MPVFTKISKQRDVILEINSDIFCHYHKISLSAFVQPLETTRLIQDVIHEIL